MYLLLYVLYKRTGRIRIFRNRIFKGPSSLRGCIIQFLVTKKIFNFLLYMLFLLITDIIVYYVSTKLM